MAAIQIKQLAKAQEIRDLADKQLAATLANKPEPEMVADF